MNVWTLRRISILGLTITLVGIHPAAQGPDSSIGTWVLNIPKSTFNPGPAPKSESRTYVMVHQETKLTTKGTTEPLRQIRINEEIQVTSTGVDRDG